MVPAPDTADRTGYVTTTDGTDSPALLYLGSTDLDYVVVSTRPANSVEEAARLRGMSVAAILKNDRRAARRWRLRVCPRPRRQVDRLGQASQAPRSSAAVASGRFDGAGGYWIRAGSDHAIRVDRNLARCGGFRDALVGRGLDRWGERTVSRSPCRRQICGIIWEPTLRT